MMTGKLMKFSSRRLAHWVGGVAAAAVIPFVVNDVVHLKLWEATWDIWAIALGFTVLYCAVAYGIGWGLVRVIARLRKRA